MFGSSSGSATHSGVIQLKEAVSETVLASEPFKFLSNGDHVFYDKIFSSAPSVSAGVKYTITVEYYSTEDTKITRGTGGQPSTTAVCNGDAITFQFSDNPDDTNKSSPSQGQIPRILFSC